MDKVPLPSPNPCLTFSVTYSVRRPLTPSRLCELQLCLELQEGRGHFSPISGH